MKLYLRGDLRKGGNVGDILEALSKWINRIGGVEGNPLNKSVERILGERSAGAGKRKSKKGWLDPGKARRRQTGNERMGRVNESHRLDTRSK